MKIARSVGILNKLKHYLNKPSLKKLYHSLISSHINYGLLVWGSTYPSYLTKLIKLQNKAIRIVNKSHWLDSVSLIYLENNILPLRLQINFEIAKFIHFNFQNCWPPNVKFNLTTFFKLVKDSHNRRTRSTHSYQLMIPLFKTNKTQRSIKYTGPSIWNKIPIEIRQLNLPKFKKEYKKRLFTIN